MQGVKLFKPFYKCKNFKNKFCHFCQNKTHIIFHFSASPFIRTVKLISYLTNADTVRIIAIGE